jgi:hypothetical protein
MELDLTDDETAALGRLLSDAIDRDRWTKVGSKGVRSNRANA